MLKAGYRSWPSVFANRFAISRILGSALLERRAPHRESSEAKLATYAEVVVQDALPKEFVAAHSTHRPRLNLDKNAMLAPFTGLVAANKASVANIPSGAMAAGNTAEFVLIGQLTAVEPLVQVKAPAPPALTCFLGSRWVRLSSLAACPDHSWELLRFQN